MEYMDALEYIFNNMKKDIKKVNDDINKEVNEIDKKWIELLNSKCKLKTNNKVYVAKDAIEEIKRQKESILSILSNDKLDSKKQVELSQNLTYLNEVLLEYENSFKKKEEEKTEAIYTKGKNKKAQAIRNAILKSIDEIDKEIAKVTEFVENTKDLTVNGTDADAKLFNKYVKNLKELQKFKTAMESLLNENAQIKRASRLSELTKGLNNKNAKIVSAYYNAIAEDNINMSKIDDTPVNQTSFDDLDEETKNIVNQINYYLEIAETNKDKKSLDLAVELIKKLPESDIKNDLQARAAEINELINNEIFAEAEKLVAKAEQTEKYDDWKAALTILKQLPDCDKTNDLKERLLKVCEKNEKTFDAILKQLYAVAQKGEDQIDQAIIEELRDRYCYLKDSYIHTIQNEYDYVIAYYNKNVQDNYHASLDKKDFVKYNFMDKLREFSFSLVGGNLLAKKINKAKLKNLNKKKTKAKAEKQDKIDKKIEKVKQRIADGDVVNNLRLFTARNKLAKKKYRLYQNDVKKVARDFKVVDKKTDKERLEYRNHATNTISNVLRKKLGKITKDSSIKEDKERVISILDQYLELLASGSLKEKDIDAAYKYLESVKDVLSDTEYTAYYLELREICNYRNLSSNIPYHIKNTNGKHEVEDIMEYYDSDSYKNRPRDPGYIKRK